MILNRYGDYEITGSCCMIFNLQMCEDFYMKLLGRLLVAGVLVFALDWVTKVWAEQNLVPHQPVPIIGEFFRLTLGYNTGVAFGMFSNGGVWPLVVTGGIITVLVLWFIRSLYADHFPPSAAWPIGLLLGGAIGNFLDRLPDGRVTDFIDVGVGDLRWPTFNLADSFILIGVGFLILLSFNYKPHQSPAAAPDSNPDGLTTG
jgi:signal peptidase II